MEVTAAVGTLPQRLEVTFSSAHSGDTSPVDEAAAGYLQLLAMHHHLSQHHLTAIHATARQVVHGPSLSTGPAPISVFDVHRPVEQHRAAEFSPTVGPNITSS